MKSLKSHVVVLVIAALAFSGCLCKKYGPDSKWCKVQTLAVDCTIDFVKNAAIQFLPAIMAILHADMEQAKKFAQLDALVDLGKDAAVCAIAQAPSIFSARLGGPPLLAERSQMAIRDAKAYMQRKRIIAAKLAK